MVDRIEGGSWFRHGALVADSVVGTGSFVGFRVTVRHATIGGGAQIAARARILGSPARPVRIGIGVWIGANARIAPGVEIGDHAVVGAGAEVEDDVPARTLTYGRPAAVRLPVDTRFDQGDGIEAVLALVRKRGERDTTRLSPGAPADPDAFFDCAAVLGPDVVIGRGAVLIGRPDGPSPDGGIAVGARTSLGDRLVAEGGGGLTIGERVTVGDDVTITTSTHDHRSPGRPWTAAPVHIAAGAVIGDGATIVGPVRIGARANILPGAVVTRSVAAEETSKGVFL